MSCGTPVLTSYDNRHHKWCFPEDPPVVACKSEKEIFDAMEGLSLPERRHEVGELSRRWILKYHSKRVVKDKLLESMQLAKRHFQIKYTGH
jgi:hypothetical protein